MSDVEYRPQLATLVKAPPAGDRWVHEIKYDGYRIGCLIDKKGVRLISRNGKDWTHVFPSIAEAAKKLRTSDALIDGEVAMVMPDGRTSFAALQQAAAGTASHAPLVYFVFDLIRLDGKRLDRLPLEERKARLRALVEPASPKPKSRKPGERPHPLRRPRRRRRRATLFEHAAKHRTRGHHLQAARSALSPRPARQLAEVQGQYSVGPSSSAASRIQKARGSGSARCWSATTTVAAGLRRPRRHRLLARLRHRASRAARRARAASVPVRSADPQGTGATGALGHSRRSCAK